jgi:hypothetical protein
MLTLSSYTRSSHAIWMYMKQSGSLLRRLLFPCLSFCTSLSAPFDYSEISVSQSILFAPRLDVFPYKWFGKAHFRFCRTTMDQTKIFITKSIPLLCVTFVFTTLTPSVICYRNFIPQATFVVYTSIQEQEVSNLRGTLL